MFCKWVEKYLSPALERKGISAILVTDNASYHCVAALGSINVKTITKITDVADILDRFEIPYRVGRAPIGDAL